MERSVGNSVYVSGGGHAVSKACSLEGELDREQRKVRPSYSCLAPLCVSVIVLSMKSLLKTSAQSCISTFKILQCYLGGC